MESLLESLDSTFFRSLLPAIPFTVREVPQALINSLFSKSVR